MPESDRLEHDLRSLGAAWRAVPETLRARITTIAATAPDSAAAGEPRSARRWESSIVAGVALAVCVVLLVAIPGARVTIARQADRVRQALRVAPNTEVVTPDSKTAQEIKASADDFQRQISAGRMWHVLTAYGSFGGSVHEGTSPEVRQIDQPGVLLSLTPMLLMAPDGVYRDEPVAFHHAWLSPDGVVFSVFGHASRELLLMQAPIGQGQQVAFSRVVTGDGGTAVGVAPAIETLTVKGQKITWDPDPTGMMPNNSALRWEANGVSYSLYGRALTRDEAVALFSSLRPLH